jgi:hypothetical protein
MQRNAHLGGQRQRRTSWREIFSMLDIVMIGIAAASFAALIGYALLCDRL